MTHVLKRAWCLIVVAVVVGCGSPSQKVCWNETTSSWSSFTIHRTCCQMKHCGGFFSTNPGWHPDGPATCTPTIVEPAR